MSEGFWDPLRKKTVAATPEEKVRQWFITILKDNLGVPESLMMSESGFKFGQKQFRADIIVYNRNAEPMAVVECKRPDVQISQSVAEQALKYDAVLCVKFIFLTNGTSCYAFKREGGKFKQLTSLPDFETMLTSV